MIRSVKPSTDTPPPPPSHPRKGWQDRIQLTLNVNNTFLMSNKKKKLSCISITLTVHISIFKIFMKQILFGFFSGFFFGFFFLFFIYYKEWVNTVLKLFKKDNGMVALYFSSLLLETSACEYRVWYCHIVRYLCEATKLLSHSIF